MDRVPSSTQDGRKAGNSDRGVVRGIVALASGEVVSRVVVFAGMTVLARRVGPSGFGVIGLATAICGYLVLFVRGGLDEVGARELVRRPERVISVYVAVTTIRMLIAGAAIVLLAGVAASLPRSPAERWVIGLSGLALLPLAVDPAWAFRGLQRHATVAIAQTVGQTLYVVGLLVFVHGVDDLARVPVAQFVGELVAALALALPLVEWRWRAPALAEGRQLLASAGFLTGARISRSIIVTFDVVYLGFTVTSDAVGLYTASYRICFLLMALVGSVVAAYLPRCTLARQEGLDAMNAELGRAMRVSVSIGAPLVIGSIAVAAPLLRMVFGAAFEAAGPAFMLLMVSMGAYFVHAPLSIAFLIEHRTKAQATIYAAAAVLNVAANLVLIPAYGIVGAAVATCLAEGSIAIVCLVVLRRTFRVSPRLSPLLVPALAAILMGGVVYLIGEHLHVIVRVVLGGALYFGLVRGTRTVLRSLAL